jgi:flagellar protein FlaG
MAVKPAGPSDLGRIEKMIIQTAFNPAPPATAEPRTSPPEAGRPAVAPLAEPAPPAKPTREELDVAVESLNRAPNVSAHNLKFRVDDQTERVVVKVVDKETGETVREIPPEEVLAIAESIERYQRGLLLSQEA